MICQDKDCALHPFNRWASAGPPYPRRSHPHSVEPVFDFVMAIGPDACRGNSSVARWRVERAKTGASQHRPYPATPAAILKQAREEFGPPP